MKEFNLIVYCVLLLIISLIILGILLEKERQIKLKRTQRIDKCLICEKEFINENQKIIEGIDIEYNLIYCYKCINKQKGL